MLSFSVAFDGAAPASQSLIVSSTFRSQEIVPIRIKPAAELTVFLQICMTRGGSEPLDSAQEVFVSSGLSSLAEPDWGSLKRAIHSATMIAIRRQMAPGDPFFLHDPGQQDGDCDCLLHGCLSGPLIEDDAQFWLQFSVAKSSAQGKSWAPSRSSKSLSTSS